MIIINNTAFNASLINKLDTDNTTAYIMKGDMPSDLEIYAPNASDILVSFSEKFPSTDFRQAVSSGIASFVYITFTLSDSYFNIPQLKLITTDFDDVGKEIIMGNFYSLNFSFPDTLYVKKYNR